MCYKVANDVVVCLGLLKNSLSSAMVITSESRAKKSGLLEAVSESGLLMS